MITEDNQKAAGKFQTVDNIRRFYDFLESHKEYSTLPRQKQYLLAYHDKAVSLDYLKLRHRGVYNLIMRKEGGLHDE